jgi:thioredoxin-related protein
MKQIIFLFAALFLVAGQVDAQGIKFFKGTWEEALAKAKEEEKVIFVDAFAVWCGPCKRMAQQVFPKKKVGDFFNANFINVKMDMERGEGLSFRKKYPVSAFPTLFFIDGNGKVVHKQKGAQQEDGLIKLGEMVSRKVDYSAEYAAEYEKGNREPELIYNYVKALNKSNKASVKVANDYLKTQKDLTTAFNLKFILEATSEADSRIFDLLVEHQKEIIALAGKDAFLNKIEKACTRTAQKAVEYQVEDLLTEAKSKMKKYYPEKSNNFAAATELKFYLVTSDVKNYLKCCEDYVKKEVKDDADKLHSLAIEIAENFDKDDKAMKHAEKLAKMSTQHGDNYQHYYTYANILLDNGNKTDALKIANQSLELAKNDQRASMAIKQLIEKIEQG